MTDKDWQDFNTVVIRSKSARNAQNAAKLPTPPKVKEIEAPPSVVKHDLRVAFIKARECTNSTIKGKTCMTQAELANRINVAPKDVQQLESGKMSHKDAVKIARKAERITSAKIL